MTASNPTATLPSTPTTALTDTQRMRLAEGARYALLRRLAPAIRHDMAGALQPISMVAVMLEKRLQKPDPDLLALSKNVNNINTLAREASQACMHLMTWLAPRVDEPTPVGTGIADAISLIATNLSFQGYSLDNQTESSTAELPISVLRGLFMASLLAMTDSHVGPARVVLAAHGSPSASPSPDALVLSITLEPTDGEVLPGMPAPYRSLDWEDVQALAAAESVQMTRTSHRVELHFAVSA